MKRLTGILYMILFPLWVQGQAVEYPIDASHSVISFSVGFAGGITSIEGRFNSFEGVVGYRDQNDRSTFYAEVSIDAGSINTGDPERDEDLRGEQFFDVSGYPALSFKSSRVSQSADGFEVTGTFSMKGVTKELSIPFRFSHPEPIVWVFGEPRIAARGSLVLDRKVFNIPARGWNGVVPALGTMVLSEEVEINLVVHGVGPDLAHVLLAEIEQAGTQSARTLYEKLEKEHTGRETYVFGSRSLYALSMLLVQDGKNDEALDMATFSSEIKADDFLSFYTLASVHRARGDREKTIENLEKSIELNPAFTAAQNELDQLKAEQK